MRIAPIDSL